MFKELDSDNNNSLDANEIRAWRLPSARYPSRRACSDESNMGQRATRVITSVRMFVPWNDPLQSGLLLDLYL